jgi:hypothetical protein
MVDTPIKSLLLSQGWDAYRQMFLPAALDATTESALRQTYYAGAGVVAHHVVSTLQKQPALVGEIASMLFNEVDDFARSLPKDTDDA